MQKAFDFFMQIIQRLLKPELCGERRGEWGRSACGRKLLKFMLGKTTPTRKWEWKRWEAECLIAAGSGKKGVKFFRTRTCDKLVSKHQCRAIFCCLSAVLGRRERKIPWKSIKRLIINVNKPSPPPPMHGNGECQSLFVVRSDRAGIMRSFFFVGKFSAPFAAELSSKNREICNSQVSFIHHD